MLGQTISAYYDPQVERVVLVNGAEEQGPAKPTELWSWDGNTWELLDASGPEARSFGGVARDPNRGVLVVQGGISSSGTEFDETLEWDGSDWTVHPGGRRGTRATRRPRVCLGPSVGADLAVRRRLEPRAAARDLGLGRQRLDAGRRHGPSAAFREPDGRRPLGRAACSCTAVTGFEGNDGGFLDDTWRWDGNAWAEVAQETGPGPRVNAPGAWDERLGGIVMHGGGEDAAGTMSTDTWLWNDGWTLLETPTAPTPRNAPALAFDSKRQVLVLVGGIDRPGGKQRLDVWELDASGWHEVLAPT